MSMLDDDYDLEKPPPAGCVRDLVTVALFVLLVVVVFGVLYQLGAAR